MSGALGAVSAREPSATYLVQREVPLIRGFELLATSRRGVTALRESISSLALQGRLVGQVSTDEPAALLVRRIAAANGRGCPHFVDANLPVGWSRVSFGDYASRLNTGPFGSLIGKGDYVRGGVPLVNPSHMRNGRIAAEVGVAVSPKKAGELAPYALATGDIVFARRGEVGRTALVTENEDGWLCGTGSFFARFEQDVDRAFLQLIFDSVAMRRYLAGEAVGVTMVNLNQRMLRNATLDIPPLAEQHRIVARVEELMKLCDALEQSGRLADEQHARLTSTLFDALAANESAHALAENWQRIAEHFDLLLDRPEAIAALEQTILQLAVRGLLVPQDAADEPAGALLGRLRAEQERLISIGQIRREKVIPTLLDDDSPFELPKGWVWARLGALANFIDYRGRTPVKTTSGVPLITAKNVRQGFINREPREYIAAGAYDGWMIRGFPRTGDLLFTTEAPLGNVAAIDITERFSLAQRVICLGLYEIEMSGALSIFLQSPWMQDALAVQATGVTAQGIKSARLQLMPLPVPPLAEQHRIVARVEELRRLCAQLRERLTEARRTQSQLAEALVAEVLA